jgi:hypothetical protein
MDFAVALKKLKAVFMILLPENLKSVHLTLIISF